MAVNKEDSARRAIPTLVKDSALVEERRRKIVEAAVALFVRKGYHPTTTREIARAAGVSIGSLYEYVQSKEDVLYLVCDAIHREIEARLREEIGEGKAAVEILEDAMRGYFQVCDAMQDSILLIYRETASLDRESQRYVLQNEERITEIFAEILRQGLADGSFRFEGVQALALMSHNIVVLGHMWAFRRWFLRGKFNLDGYTRYQTSLILHELTKGEEGEQL